MNSSAQNAPGQANWTPARERLLLLTLAAIQFTLTVDFLIIMPLGPQYLRVFHITPGQFGHIVAAYGIAAGISGLTAGFFLDRFDRKWALLWLYLGFTVGTLFCALSHTYVLLVASRFFAGAFGGVVGAVVLAIVGDVVPMERRGAAMGIVMSSFSIASIIGVPLGMYIGTGYGWYLPFFVVAGVSAIFLVAAAWITPHLRQHMEHEQYQHPVARTLTVMLHPDHQKAFVFMAVLAFASFLINPIMPIYMVANAGMTEGQLGWIYVCGGLCTLFSMNWIGRWADRSGKYRVFTIMSLACGVPIMVLTNLSQVPLVAALTVSTAFMICMSGRYVPAMAMVTGAVEARYRGGFMSINSAVQQFAMGLATLVGGMIIGRAVNGEITHFAVDGVLAVVCAYACIYLAKFLKPVPEERGAPKEAAVFAEVG